jgi:hypothetical protein
MTRVLGSCQHTSRLRRNIEEGIVRRQMFAVAAAAVLALVVLALPAGAASRNNPKANIQSGNAFCGANVSSLTVIGFTNYHRVGNTVSVEYHLKNAIPNSSYSVQLWGNSCSFFGYVKTVKTNSKGVANGTGAVAVPGSSTRFFATAFGPNGYNDTPAVTLNP